MNSLIDGAVSRARMVLSILVCAIVAGAIVYSNLPKEANPEIKIPIVAITIPLEGISPQDAERLLVRPVEQELRSIEGLKRMDAYGHDGAGQFILEFEMGTDIDQALVDVRDKVNMAKRELPAEIREPVIEETNTALFPVIVINLYGDLPERGLYRIARDLQANLEGIQGVLEANISGEREEVLEIQVDPVKLETYNLSYQTILNTIQANNRLIPAGQIDMGEGRYSIKIPGLIETAADAFDLPVKRIGERVVTLKDVAQVRRTFKDRQVYASFDGQPSVSIQVVKRSGANILDTIASIRSTVNEMQTTWPETLHVELTSDESKSIRDQLVSLQSSIVTAIVLVMIICVAALGFRSALLVGISIPASFLIGFLFLGLAGYTINSMVLFAMVIAVGILVDGGIVIVEFADRKMAEGLHRKEAYALAGKRMFWPILASNATTLAAFLPFLFWNSIPGKFMSFLPITLIFVLSASLFSALIFLPVLGGIIGGRSKGGDDDLKALSGDDGDPLAAKGFIGFYAKLISALVNMPLRVTIVLIAISVSICVWFANTAHNVEFFLDVEPEQLYVYVGAEGNLSASEEYEIVQRAEKLILPVKGISSVSTQSGSAATATSFGGGEGSIPLNTIGKILINIDTVSPGIDGRKVVEDIRKVLDGFVGGEVEVAIPDEGPPVGKDVQISVLSNDYDALLKTTGIIRQKMDTVEGLIEVEDTRPLKGIEWNIRVDRERAAQYGVDVSQIGGAVQLVTSGVLVGRFRPDDSREEIDIRVRLPKEARSLEALDNLKLATPDGPTPLSTFVERYAAPRLDRIDRRDSVRIFTLRANAAEQGQGAAMTQVMKDWVATQKFDPGVKIEFDGADEETAEAGVFFETAGLAALFLMGVILLWEFNNFYHVVLTLSAVIISTIGVLIGLQVASDFISIIMTGTGVVALAGIVVNNNIVLIDTFQHLIKDGRTAQEAAVATAAQRMRPILLTTGTTICGLLPMVLAVNINFGDGTITKGGSVSEWWVPLATAVVFGLGFSTFVTLLVTPVWLAAPEKMGRWRDRNWTRFLNLTGFAGRGKAAPEPRQIDEKLDSAADHSTEVHAAE